jgi:hypothetical protein
LKELQRAGFDMKKLSIVGKVYHSDDHVVGYYNVGVQYKTAIKADKFLLLAHGTTEEVERA